jgi:hypothetical protein
MTRANMRITTAAATTPPIKPELVDEWPGAAGGDDVVLEDGPPLVEEEADVEDGDDVLIEL